MSSPLLTYRDTDFINDDLSKKFGPASLNTAEDWIKWELLINKLALSKSATNCNNFEEVKINLMTGVAIGERRKQNCGLALKIFKRCEEKAKNRKVSRICRISSKFNTACCFKFMNQTKMAIPKLMDCVKSVKDVLNLKVGKKVLLVGLVNATELNSKFGQIINVTRRRTPVVVSMYVALS